MKVIKSLQDVWNWKEKAYERRKSLTMEEKIQKIKEGAEEMNRKYDLHLMKINPLLKWGEKR